MSLLLHQDVLHGFGKFWFENYVKYSLTEMLIKVISLSLHLMCVHKSSAFMIAETAWINQCSSLHHPDMTNCLISLLLIGVHFVFLMLCYDNVLVKQALRLRIARPMCDCCPFASSPFRRLASRGLLFSLRHSSVVAFSWCSLSVETPVPSRSSALLKRNS